MNQTSSFPGHKKNIYENQPTFPLGNDDFCPEIQGKMGPPPQNPVRLRELVG